MYVTYVIVWKIVIHVHVHQQFCIKQLQKSSYHHYPATIPDLTKLYKWRIDNKKNKNKTKKKQKTKTKQTNYKKLYWNLNQI